MQNNGDVANASFPDDVKTMGVTTRKASSDMGLVVSIYTPNNTYDR